MIYTVFIPNAIAMILLLVLLFSANNVSSHIHLLDSKIFVTMVTCNFLQCIGEIVSYTIEGVMFTGFHVLNLIVNSLLFIINIFFAYLWVIYADYRIYQDVERTKKRGKILMIPSLIIIICSIVNLFVPVFFRITKDNHYQRTLLYLVPYLATYLYLIYGTFFIYRHRGEAKKYVFLPAVVFMLPILLGSIVQFFYYGVSTVWVGVAIALVSVYVNIQNEMSYTDILSGLYTRNYMYQYLEIAIRKKSTHKIIVGIMMDIDNFKMINDTYGHLTGDDAIRSAGKIIRKVLRNNSIAARYGGDEFVILLQIQTEDEIKSIIDQIESAEKKLNDTHRKEYCICFSKGYTILNPNEDTVDAFIERMDKAMYEVKKERKKNI